MSTITDPSGGAAKGALAALDHIALVLADAGCGCQVAAWWNIDTGRQLSPWRPIYPKDEQGRDLYLIPGGLPEDARHALQRE